MSDPQAKKTRRSRRLPVILAGLVVLLVIGWSALWGVGAHLIGTKFDEIIAQQAALGTRITCADRAIGGWPFRLDVACTPLTVERADGSRLSLPAARAVALVYRPNHIILEADAPATIDPAGMAPDGRAEWTLGHASLKFSTGGLTALAAQATELSLSGFEPLGLRAGLKAADVELHTRRNPGDPTRIDIAASLTKLVDGTSPDAPPLDVDLRLTVPDPRRTGTAMPLSLTAETGTIDVVRADISGGDTRLGVAGTLQLDAFATPSGTLTLTVDQPDGLEALLARLLPPESPLVKAITGAVTGFGRKTEEDGKTRIDMPVTIRNGTVSLGLIPLGRLPRAR